MSDTPPKTTDHSCWALFPKDTFCSTFCRIYIYPHSAWQTPKFRVSFPSGGIGFNCGKVAVFIPLIQKS